MKKIYKSLFITMIAAAGFTACSDYEAPDITTESAITIVSRNTDFPAAASTGVIKFKADGPVTVSSANDWITASVEGDEINISVVQNNSIDGRAGSIIVKSGNAEDEISIIQSGIIFKFDEVGEIATDSDPSTHAYPIDANAPIEVSSDADWVKVHLNRSKPHTRSSQCDRHGQMRRHHLRNPGSPERSGIPPLQNSYLKSK